MLARFEYQVFTDFTYWQAYERTRFSIIMVLPENKKATLTGVAIKSV
jgi:hypothetical protein